MIAGDVHYPVGLGQREMIAILLRIVRSRAPVIPRRDASDSVPPG